jgi:hypothetical protein
MKKIVIRLSVVLVMLMAPSVVSIAFSQPPPTTVNPEVPLDGGLTALLAAGLLYGARKLRSEKGQLD